MLEFLRRLLGVVPPVPTAPIVVPAPPRIVAERLPIITRPATLRELLHSMPNRRLPLPSAVELVCRLCDLLAEVHEPLRGVGPADVYF
jgi:hypothetical protein